MKLRSGFEYNLPSGAAVLHDTFHSLCTGYAMLTEHDTSSINSEDYFECEFCHLMLEGWEKDYHFDGHWCYGCNKSRPCYSYKCECGHVEEENDEEENDEEENEEEENE